MCTNEWTIKWANDIRLALLSKQQQQQQQKRLFQAVSNDGTTTIKTTTTKQTHIHKSSFFLATTHTHI